MLRAIDELGYRPNAAARTLVRRRSNAIAVLVTDLHNLFLPEVVGGLDAVIESRGYTTLIVSGKQRERAEVQALHRVLELRVDGIVCATARLGRDALLDAARSTALVNLTRTPELPRVDSVVNDDHAGATLVVEHLAQLGHRRIAMIGDTDERAGADRIRGYRDAMVRLGLASGDRGQAWRVQRDRRLPSPPRSCSTAGAAASPRSSSPATWPRSACSMLPSIAASTCRASCR